MTFSRDILRSLAANQKQRDNKPMKVKGLGGVFVKANDPEKLYSWYSEYLGLERTPEGAFIVPTDRLMPEYMVVSFVPTNTSYFSPNSPCMLNFQVENLAQLLTTRASKGAKIDDRLEEGEHGRFGWVYDPEGNKIELWEPPPYDLSLIELPEAE